MTTFAQVIQAAIPGADEKVCDFIMWERTPYPCGAVSAKELYKSASGFKRAAENGLRLCDLCHRVAEDGYTCQHCEEILANVRKQNAARDLQC